MVVDFHTHCFPEKIAAKAMEQLRLRSGILEPLHDGTVEGLVSLQRKGGVDYSVVLNIATNPNQQTNVNNFAISLKGVDGVVPFGSVHHESPDALSELERLAENGIKGVKLHPDYQEFYCDDDKMLPIYEKIGELGLVTVFHCGLDMGYPRPMHCDPKRLASVLPSFGGAPVVAAHFGGLVAWDETEEYLVGTEIYLDTAYSYGMLPPKIATPIIKAHGADKILMGSDAPWSNPAHYVEFVDCLAISDEEKQAILGGNAQRLLGL